MQVEPRGVRSSTVPASAWLMLTALILLGAWLRISGLDKSAWIDEVISLCLATGGIGEVLGKLQPQHMPLYFWILAPFVAVSDQVAWLRIPNVLFGIGIIPLVFMIGVEMGRLRAGLVAAGLAAVSGFLIHYSQEIRMYCLLIFLGVLGTWGTVRLMRCSTGWSARWGWFVLVVASLLNLYTSPFAIFMVVVHWLIVMGLAWSHRAMRIPYVACASFVALAFIPGLLHMYSMVDGSAGVVSGAYSPYGNLYHLFDSTLHHFANMIPPLRIPLVICGILGVIISLRSNRLFSLLAVLALALPLFAFHILEPKHFYNPRYVSYAQPHLLLLVGIAVVLLWDCSIGRLKMARRLVIVGPSCAAVLTFTLAVNLIPGGRLAGQVADWQSVARVIVDGLASRENPDMVAIVPGWEDNTLVFNMDQVSPVGRRPYLLNGSSQSTYRILRRKGFATEFPNQFLGPEVLLRGAKGIAEFEQLADDHPGRVWVVTSYSPKLLRLAGFEEIFRMPRFHSYSGGSAVWGPRVFLRSNK